MKYFSVFSLISIFVVLLFISNVLAEGSSDQVDGNYASEGENAPPAPREGNGRNGGGRGGNGGGPPRGQRGGSARRGGNSRGRKSQDDSGSGDASLLNMDFL